MDQCRRWSTSQHWPITTVLELPNSHTREKPQWCMCLLIRKIFFPRPIPNRIKRLGHHHGTMICVHPIRRFLIQQRQPSFYRNRQLPPHIQAMVIVKPTREDLVVLNSRNHLLHICRPGHVPIFEPRTVVEDVVLGVWLWEIAGIGYPGAEHRHVVAVI